jgi:hypothetical protein
MMTPEECYALNQGLHLYQETEVLIMSITPMYLFAESPGFPGATHER